MPMFKKGDKIIITKYSNIFNVRRSFTVGKVYEVGGKYYDAILKKNAVCIVADDEGLANGFDYNESKQAELAQPYINELKLKKALGLE